MKFRTVFLLLVVFFIDTSSARITDISEFEDDSAEVMTRPTKNKDDGIIKPANDALFSFIDKLINTGYLSSKLALNRVRTQSEATKKIEDQIGKLLENLPNFHVPILDDLHSVKYEIPQDQ